MQMGCTVYRQCPGPCLLSLVNAEVCQQGKGETGLLGPFMTPLLPKPGAPASPWAVQAPAFLTKGGLTWLARSRPTIMPLPASICAHVLHAPPETGNNASCSAPPPPPGSRCRPWHVSLPVPRHHVPLSVDPFLHSHMPCFALSSEKREKSLTLSPPPAVPGLLCCFVCCGTSGRSCLCWLSAVPPLPLSLTPASAGLLPLLLTFPPPPPERVHPAGSLSTSESRSSSPFSALSHLTCHSSPPPPPPPAHASSPGILLPALSPLTEL